MARIILIAVVALLLAGLPSVASLSPQDVIVIYNNSVPSDGAGYYDWSASKAVADAYCTARGIPTANEFGIKWGQQSEQISDPNQFVSLILNPLKQFLSSRPGFSVDDPSHDAKCLVLCYGVPLKVAGGDRISSIDSVLSLLFSDAKSSDPTSVDPAKSWGVLPMGGYGSVTRGEQFIIDNPYYRSYSDTSGKPQDFGVFRTGTGNDTTKVPPSFTIVRQFDDTHAVAAVHKLWPICPNKQLFMI
jgi:hypothetical protein